MGALGLIDWDHTKTARTYGLHNHDALLDIQRMRKCKLAIVSRPVEILKENSNG